MKFTMEATCPRENCPEAGEDGHECKLFLNFLDLKMFISAEGQILTDMYRKPNKKCQYLSPESEHPRHIFSNIPKSLVHSVVRNVSVPGMLNVRLEELRLLLRSRGYKAGDLQKAVEYGLKLDRDKALEKVTKKDDKNRGRVRYTVVYDSKLPQLPKILERNWRVMVESDRRLTKAFPAPPMACLKRGPNLKDKLVRARLPAKLGKLVSTRLQDQKKGFSCCRAGRKNCVLCEFTGPAADRKTVVTEVKIEHSGLVIPILQKITCRDTFCQYLLSCRKPGCMKQYWGCTTRPLSKRFSEHLSDTQDPNTTCPVGLHWQLPGHTVGHLQFLGVEKLGTRSWPVLRAREREKINFTGLVSAGINRTL